LDQYGAERWERKRAKGSLHKEDRQQNRARVQKTVIEEGTTTSHMMGERILDEQQEGEVAVMPTASNMSQSLTPAGKEDKPTVKNNPPTINDKKPEPTNPKKGSSMVNSVEIPAENEKDHGESRAGRKRKATYLMQSEDYQFWRARSNTPKNKDDGEGEETEESQGRLGNSRQLPNTPEKSKAG